MTQVVAILFAVASFLFVITIRSKNYIIDKQSALIGEQSELIDELIRTERENNAIRYSDRKNPSP